MHVYTPLRPDEYGRVFGGGYKCGACGLEGLEHGEPHYSAAGRVCEPAPPADIPEFHPQAKYVGQPVTAMADPGNGQLVRDGAASPPQPPPEEPATALDQPNAETPPFSVQRDQAASPQFELGGPSEDTHPSGGLYDVNDPQRPGYNPGAIDAGPHPAYQPEGGAAVLPEDQGFYTQHETSSLPFQADAGVGDGGPLPEPTQHNL